ncbi:MAG: ung [Gammaproteobacteria bacterium]|jgi:uracil-DNA glycosylase|nr:ung [Gammaproteobacteria bacterium]
MPTNTSLPNWLTKAIQTQADQSWHAILYRACETLPEEYLAFLETHAWLPGKDKVFNAFQLPLAKTQYILYGESPYPRAASAQGFAFWDAAVKEIWSEKGLSKPVNRATSLRNLIKMLMSISRTENYDRVNTLDELFRNLLRHGFLLLNFNLSLSEIPKTKEAKYWFLFHSYLLEEISQHCQPTLVLFGKIAELVLKIPASKKFKTFISEHPYNLSFITNPRVLDFFKPLELLIAK